jgi:hypothetical protein
MKPDDTDKLKRILAAFDEAGLVALSNVGLVRRARKDLEAGGVSHEETDKAMIVRGPDWTVTMPPDGPTKATDSTKATGITRQILAATIYLREVWASGDREVAGSATDVPEDSRPPLAGATKPGEALAEMVLALTIDDLRKWAGKTALRDALTVLNPPPQVEVETHAGLLIRLVKHGVEARLLPGAGGKPAELLDSVKTTAPKAHHARWVAIAVLAFQASRGKAIERGDATIEAGPSGAPVTREQVLRSARELFASMVTTGLAHLSDRTAQRLFTLSVSATAVMLPRLSRLVRSIADDVQLSLDRNANADTPRLFGRLHTADALAQAMLAAGENPPASLAGKPRTEYELAGDLVLVGVGAYPWQTASGFEGVTALFWDLENNRFLSWSASRPVTTPGRFTAETAYRHETVWNCGPAEQLSRSLIHLRAARVNPAGRISGGKESTAESLEPTQPARIDFGGRGFDDWAALGNYAASSYPIGLAELRPMERIVVLKPAAWGERVFDEMQQCLCWPVMDKAGRPLVLTVPWNGVNESIVEFLEAVRPGIDKLTHVVARLVSDARGTTVEPLSLLGEGNPHGHRVFSPGFDRKLIESKNADLLEKLRAKFGKDRIPTTMSDDDDAPSEISSDATHGLAGMLREFDSILVSVAEAGVRRGTLGTRAAELFRTLRDSGLSLLTDPFTGKEPATDLLHAGYLVNLHRQAMRAVAPPSA